jgi:hypothetical protein
LGEYPSIDYVRFRASLTETGRPRKPVPVRRGRGSERRALLVPVAREAQTVHHLAVYRPLEICGHLAGVVQQKTEREVAMRQFMITVTALAVFGSVVATPQVQTPSPAPDQSPFYSGLGYRC